MIRLLTPKRYAILAVVGFFFVALLSNAPLGMRYHTNWPVTIYTILVALGGLIAFRSE